MSGPRTAALRLALGLFVGAFVGAFEVGPAAAEAPAPGVVERSRLEVQPGVARAITQVSIDNPLGDVRVEGYDGTSILIETRKQAPDEATLERLHVSLVPDPDGTVRISTSATGGREVRSVGRGQVRVDLVIRAPRDARIDASVGTGTLEVKDLDAGGELDSASGPIRVQNVAGMLVTHSLSGATSITQAFGSVDAESVSSDVSLDTIGGDRLIASVSKGKIAGRRVRSRNVELTTTDGSIVLEAEAMLRGRMVISTLRGDIDVRVHQTGALVVRARGVKVDLGPAMAAVGAEPGGWTRAHRGVLQPGAVASMIELRSRHGNVQFAIVE